jgi:hypothetical protein
MLSYKSFKEYKLFENNQTDQVDGLIKLKESGIVSFGQGAWIWNPEKNRIDFNSNLRITPRFAGTSFLELPFRIGSVSGDFVCSRIDSLRSLEGGPIYVEGDFDASLCDLRSLEGSPEFCTNFNASQNLLRSIKGSPKIVMGDFDLSNNMINNLDFGPLMITGSCKLLGNAKVTKKEGDSDSDAKKFSNMHRKITYDNLVIDGKNYGGEIPAGFAKSMEKIDNSIKDKTFFMNLIMEDPEYSKFLGNFKEEIDKLNYIKKAKVIGII